MDARGYTLYMRISLFGFHNIFIIHHNASYSMIGLFIRLWFLDDWFLDEYDFYTINNLVLYYILQI
jgi:hypothetical protein